MKLTGYKDKKGTEVKVGDVLRFNGLGSYMRACAIKEEKCGFIAYEVNGCPWELKGLTNLGEVVGNINENPNLLNQFTDS